MKWRWISLALLATGTFAPANPDFAAARRLIHDWMAKDSLPGLAVAVLRGDSILWEEGFGWANREERVAATAHTPFYLASVTKTITATAAMLLHERGRLDLDRPANEYLGESPLWSPAWPAAGATVRRLASHTAGLSTFDLQCAPDRPVCRAPSFDEIMRRYGVLVWPPGEHFDYSNLGYYALGKVVARAAGQDLGDFLRQELFRPLGMTHSSLGVDPGLARQTAVSYSWTRGPLPRQTGEPSGASSVYASAHDLARFGAFHLKAYRNASSSLLSDVSIDAMQVAVVPEVGRARYGLGWWVEEDRFGYRSLLAQGGTDASQAWLRLVPSERIAVVVLANKGVGFPGQVVDELISALLPRYADLRAQAATGQPASAPSPTGLDTTFVGRWAGFVRAEDGDIPVEFTVTDSGAVRGRIGAPSGERSGRARFATALFRLSIPGDLETPDSTPGRRLAFYLRPRNGGLNGVATTGPRAGSGLEGRVSYWAELSKQP